MYTLRNMIIKYVPKSTSSNISTRGQPLPPSSLWAHFIYLSCLFRGNYCSQCWIYYSLAFKSIKRIECSLISLPFSQLKKAPNTLSLNYLFTYFTVYFNFVYFKIRCYYFCAVSFHSFSNLYFSEISLGLMSNILYFLDTKSADSKFGF